MDVIVLFGTLHKKGRDKIRVSAVFALYGVGCLQMLGKCDLYHLIPKPIVLDDVFGTFPATEVCCSVRNDQVLVMIHPLGNDASTLCLQKRQLQ